MKPSPVLWYKGEYMKRTVAIVIVVLLALGMVGMLFSALVTGTLY